MKVVLTERAIGDLMAQLDWLDQQSPNAAVRAVDIIHARLALLAEFPRSAPSIDPIHRQAAVRFGHDGFVVRYRLTADAVVVVRIFHGRQER